MIRREHLADRLRNVPLFSACTRTELRILARQFQQNEVPAGASLCREGEDADAFYVILSGEATVSKQVHGKPTHIATLGPGSWFGELALLDPSPRSASVSADDPMVIAVLGKRAFRAVLRDVPALSDRLLATLARRVRDSTPTAADDHSVVRSEPQS
jgi:CRP-like cAMP-binding protein